MTTSDTQSLDKTSIEKRNPPHRIVTMFYVIACTLATLQFLRSYFIIDSPYLNALKYELGSERMPFQARILMSVLMRHAESSSIMTQIAGKMRGPLRSPDTFCVFLVGLVSLAVIAFVVRAFYRSASVSGQLAWLPYPLVLAMMAETYIVRFQEAIYFPYDLLAACLFTLCVYLCYTRRYLLLLPVFILGCFARETIILVVPLVLLNIDSLPNSLRDSRKELVTAAGLAVIWLTVFVSLNHLYAHNESESFLRIHANLSLLRNPLQWSQVASGCGFLMLVPLLFWRAMPDRRLRMYSLLIPVWIVIIFFVGMLAESRVFGELIGFIAVYCTILFETIYLVRRRYSTV